MSGIIDLGKKAYGLFARGADLLQSPLLLAIRAFWGWQLAQNGWGKLHNLGGVTQYFTELGLPHPTLFAPAVATLEFVGGSLLLAGLLSRPIALILAGNMIGAYVTADSEAWHSFFGEDSGKFFAADPFPFLMVSLIVLVFGPGLFSLDALIGRLLKKPEAKR